MGLTLAVVGGGSTYTPELVEGVVGPAAIDVGRLVLQDRDPRRLGIVGDLADRMARRSAWHGELVRTTDLRRAVSGADIVLVQLRVGGQAARLVDETVPLRFGTIGQETTGAGGFAKALRTVPVVLEIAEVVRAEATDACWIIDFTNPVGIVSQALIDAGHRAIGLCNMGIGMQHRFAAALGVPDDSVEIEHAGLNHLSWERAARVGGRDRLPELIQTHAEAWAAEAGMTPASLRALAMVPSSYLRYYEGFDAVLAEQGDATPRAATVRALEEKLLAAYADPALDRKPEQLAARGGAHYSEAAMRLVAALTMDSRAREVVDVRNVGALPGLADDDVVEVTATVDATGAHPIPQRPLPPTQMALLRAVKRYERLTIRAALSGDRDLALEALTTHPLVGPRVSNVRGLLEALLEAHSAHLPRFAG